VYVHDENGRLLSSAPEAEWSPQQAGWMLALAEYEAGICDGCGHPLEETLATEAEDWVTPPPVRCAVCTRIAMQMDDYADVKSKNPKPTPHMQALRWRAVRKPRRR
jgi:hypothetical protein